MDTINASNSVWNEDNRVERLETLYRDGLSFRLIAADIGVTRSAVIGKAHRMNLPKRNELTATKPHPRKRPERKTVPPVGPPKPEVVIDPGRDYRCDILGLTSSSCRFPLWPHAAPRDCERLYCGRPGASMIEGYPYCEQHSRLCGVPRLI